MAAAAEWLEGARPRTLPTAIAPVLAGTAIAITDGGARWGLAAGQECDTGGARGCGEQVTLSWSVSRRRFVRPFDSIV